MLSICTKGVAPKGVAAWSSSRQLLPKWKPMVCIAILIRTELFWTLCPKENTSLGIEFKPSTRIIRNSKIVDWMCWFKWVGIRCNLTLVRYKMLNEPNIPKKLFIFPGNYRVLWPRLECVWEEFQALSVGEPHDVLDAQTEEFVTISTSIRFAKGFVGIGQIGHQTDHHARYSYRGQGVSSRGFEWFHW